jgi:hypothetical protein
VRPRGYVSVNAAADAAGIERRAYRAKLQAEHEKQGGILWTFSKNPDAPNAKFWTTIAVLKVIDPEAFGEVTQLDILELREMVLEDRQRLTRIEKKVNIK